MAEPDSMSGNGWEDHEREQRRTWLKLSHRERLDWLWQAKLFAQRALDAASARAINRASRKG
jgi:flagellar biosynthesis chaperone FliJ